MECAIMWNVMWNGVQCNVQCGRYGAIWNMVLQSGIEVLVWYKMCDMAWTTAQKYHIKPHFQHSTHSTYFDTTRSYHVAWCGLVWCGIWCGVECSAMPDVGYGSIHPNVAVVWNKVRCRICAIWCDAKCDVVQCQTRCEMWSCDVEWWCGAWGIWWCAVMQDVKCGCGIPSDVEWFDVILDMVWCRMMVEMQCGKCGLVWNVCCGIV